MPEKAAGMWWARVGLHGVRYTFPGVMSVGAHNVECSLTVQSSIMNDAENESEIINTSYELCIQMDSRLQEKQFEETVSDVCITSTLFVPAHTGRLQFRMQFMCAHDLLHSCRQNLDNNDCSGDIYEA